MNLVEMCNGQMVYTDIMIWYRGTKPNVILLMLIYETRR